MIIRLVFVRIKSARGCWLMPYYPSMELAVRSTLSSVRIIHLRKVWYKVYCKG